MKKQMGLQLSLGFSDTIQNREEVVRNVANGILNQAINVGITNENEKGRLIELMLLTTRGEPLAHAEIGPHATNLSMISQQLVKERAGFIQREALRQISHGLATIAGQMDSDDHFRNWIEETPFFSFFTGCIDEISRSMMDIIPVNHSFENNAEICGDKSIESSI